MPFNHTDYTDKKLITLIRNSSSPLSSSSKPEIFRSSYFCPFSLSLEVRGKSPPCEPRKCHSEPCPELVSWVGSESLRGRLVSGGEGDIKILTFLSLYIV